LVIFISRRTFEQLVEEALAELPKQFADLLQNIAVVVEEEPGGDDLDLVEEPGHELLGIYRGTPLPQRSYGMPLMPDQIAIFRGPILRIARSRYEAQKEIRDTVIHELGHYFGLDDETMIY
jgi:predicted Zn-dependent protease with MMP-like domain